MHVMSKSNFVASQSFGGIVQSAASETCTKGAGVFFFAFLEYNFTDKGLFNGITYINSFAQFSDW